MKNYSLLGRQIFVVKDEEKKNMPDYFLDLNLDGIVKRICEQRKEYNLKEFYLYLPNTHDLTYRQGILKDMEQRELLNSFLQISRKLEACRQARENMEKSEEMKRDRWFLDATQNYCGALEGILAIEQQSPESEGLCLFLAHVRKLVESDTFRELSKEQKKLSEEFERMRFQFSVVRDHLIVTRELQEGDYCDRLEQLFPGQCNKEYVESPFHDSLHLSSLEESILQLFAKEDKNTFLLLHQYAERFADCFEDEIFRLERELQFYLAFLLYQQKMRGFGYDLAYPEFSNDRKTMQIEDAYDLALAQKYSVSKQEVVVNDIRYDSGEQFHVITGPNQGGKTTFARSIGQVVYFTLLGLKAPCAKARIPMFSGIMTHFSVEESLETGRGKLKEELIRLEPMIHQLSSQKFVIINELFTTAATYDAFIMGKRVMEHFMASGCLGIYVTHIQELTEGIPGTVSMVALLKPGEEHIRSFRIQRREAEGIGYADAIVERYQLTAEALEKRLVELPSNGRAIAKTKEVRRR